MTLRILHLDFHRGWGGQPSRILMSSAELARRGHSLAIAVPDEGELARRARGAGLQVFGDFGFYKPRHVGSAVHDVRSLRRTLLAFRPDLIHSHGSQDTWTSVVANRTLGSARVPHVVTRHNSKVVACHAANRYLYGRAIDRLVVVSYAVLDRFEEFFRRGVLDRSRIPVIPSSIDFGRYDRPLDAGALRRELRLDADTPLVGCVGRLVRDKGQHVLLRAFTGVRAVRPDARLALVGTGTERAALERLTAELGLSDSVHFLGFRDDVPEITAAVNVAVLPSVDCDASPAVVKEAMYLQRPVVVTDIGGLREMVEDGVSGRVVPPENPEVLARVILGLLADPARARAMGARAREVVRTRFSLQALGDAYERVYKELVSDRSRRR